VSHRGDLTARMVELPLLLAEKAYSQRELIEYFDVDRKTIKRAIDALSMQYQIFEEQRGREVLYRFAENYKFIPPALTPGEVAVLLLAQETITATGLSAFASPFNEHARRLLLKVRSVLPAALRDKLDALANVYGTAAVPAKDFAPHAVTIDLLTDAAVTCRRIRMLYYSLTDAQTKSRVVDPYSVYFDPDGATLKLLGYDYLRSMVIPFSVDHIRKVEITDEVFQRPQEFNLRSYLLEHCFNGIHGEPVTVRLRAIGATARVFAERQFHPSQITLESTPANANRPETTTIELRVAGGRGLERFILSWSPDIEVLDPPELRTAILAASRRMVEHFSGPQE
jgi:predicted DNA-binding transcriptional regulator YafY